MLRPTLLYRYVDAASFLSPKHWARLAPLRKTFHQAMIVSGAVPPIIVLANSGSFETKTQCMSILQRMLLGRAMPDEVRK